MPTGAPMTDGLAALDNSDEKLTACACWQVKFNEYTYMPILVVPFDTGLDAIEYLARRAMLEHLSKRNSTTPSMGLEDYASAEDKFAAWATKVASLWIVTVTRQPTVLLDPTLG
jgi:hypothetical protein